MAFRKKKTEKTEKDIKKMLKKGHDMTVGELLKITEAIDNRFEDMGMCSHQKAIIGQMLMNANSQGDGPEIAGMMGGMVSGGDMKEILEKIADKLNNKEE